MGVGGHRRCSPAAQLNGHRSQGREHPANSDANGGRYPAVRSDAPAATDVEPAALDQTSSFFEVSDGDEPVGGLDEPSDIGWCDPLPADRGQVFVGRLTGDRTSLSNIDGQVVLPRFGEQVADRWHPDALQAVAHAVLEQFGCIACKYDADVVTDFQRAVDGEVKWNRGAGRVGAAGRGHVQRPHE